MATKLEEEQPQGLAQPGGVEEKEEKVESVQKVEVVQEKPLLAPSVSDASFKSGTDGKVRRNDFFFPLCSSLTTIVQIGYR